MVDSHTIEIGNRTFRSLRLEESVDEEHERGSGEMEVRDETIDSMERVRRADKKIDRTRKCFTDSSPARILERAHDRGTHGDYRLMSFSRRSHKSRCFGRYPHGFWVKLPRSQRLFAERGKGAETDVKSQSSSPDGAILERRKNAFREVERCCRGRHGSTLDGKNCLVALAEFRLTRPTWCLEVVWEGCCSVNIEEFLERVLAFETQEKTRTLLANDRKCLSIRKEELLADAGFPIDECGDVSASVPFVGENENFDFSSALFCEPQTGRYDSCFIENNESARRKRVSQILEDIELDAIFGCVINKKPRLIPRFERLFADERRWQRVVVASEILGEHTVTDALALYQIRPLAGHRLPLPPKLGYHICMHALRPFLLLLYAGTILLALLTWADLRFLRVEKDWLFFLSPLMFAAGVVAGAAILLRCTLGRWQWKGTCSPLTVLATVLAFTLSLFLVMAFARSFPITLETFPGWKTGLSAAFHFSGEGARLATALALMSAVFFGTGELIFRIVRWTSTDEDQLSSFLAVSAVGMVSWSLMLLVLGFIGYLEPLPLLLLAGGALVPLVQKGPVLWRSLVKPLPFTIDIRSSGLWIMLIGGIFITLNIISAIRPEPAGYDDMTAYMNRAHLIAERGHLISGGFPFPFELLAAGIRVASGDETMFLALSLGLWSLLMSTLAAYRVSREFFSHETSLAAAVIWLSLPMTAALALWETKPDSLLAFVGATALGAFLAWRRNRDHRYFLLGSFLLGAAISVKVTALFLAVPIAIITLWPLKENFSLPGVRLLPVRHLLWGSLFFVLPLLPWIGYGFETRNGAFPSEILGLLQSANHSSPLTSEAWQRTVGTSTPTSHCSFTAGAEDYARYRPERPAFWNALLLPWDMTMNARVGFTINEVGILFLILLPALVLFRSNQSIVLEENQTRMLLVSAGSYFLVWAVVGEHIAWYAYPGMLFLSLLAATAVFQPGLTPVAKKFLLTLLFAGLLLHLGVRAGFAGHPLQIRYAAGFIDASEYRAAYLGSSARIIETLNETGGILYLPGSPLLYFIRDNDSRTIMDTGLDIFNCLDREREADRTLERFRSLGIRYVFVPRTLLRTPESVTAQEKTDRFLDFAGAHLRFFMGSESGTLFQVP
jgi:hypothetical protein